MFRRCPCNIFNRKQKLEITDVHPYEDRNGGDRYHLSGENTPLRTGKSSTVYPSPITQQITGNDRHDVPGSMRGPEQTEVKRPIPTDDYPFHLRTSNKIQNSHLLEREEQVKQLQGELQRVKQERDEALSRQSDSEMKHNIQTLEEQIQQHKREKEELLIRLSEYTSKHVADNNPNIADLSDINRPTKLVERFSELYDNEWIEAFEYLQKTIPSNGPEEAAVKAIKALLKVLKKIYDLCKAEASRQLEETVKSIYGLTKRKTSCGPIERSLREFKDERKQNFEAFLPDLKKQVESTEELEVHCSRNVPEYSLYIAKATELCWLMCIQDPPMELCFSGRNRKEFDGELFKAYTQTGRKIAFIVWPAVLLSENGSTLMKGVAQGRTKKKDSHIKHAKKRKSNAVDSVDDKEIAENKTSETIQNPVIGNLITVDETNVGRRVTGTDKNIPKRNVAAVGLNSGLSQTGVKQGDDDDDDDDTIFRKPNDDSKAVKDTCVSSHGNSELIMNNLDTSDKIPQEVIDQDHDKRNSIDKMMRPPVKQAFQE